MWQFIEQIIQSRGVQLLARYTANLLLVVATFFHLAPADGAVSTTAGFIASLVGAGLCWVIDHFSHSLQVTQAAAETNKAMNDAHALGVRSGIQRAVDGNVPTKIMRTLLLAFVLTALPALTGCAAKLEAMASAALASALTHVETNISFDPVTGTATASVHLKDAQGRDIYRTRPATHAERKQLAEEMRAAARRLKDCGHYIIESAPPQASGPQVGDVLQTEPEPAGEIATIPDANTGAAGAADGSFSIPPARGVQSQCKNGRCK